MSRAVGAVRQIGPAYHHGVARRKRKQESWERPAEELVELLSVLLDAHWTAIRNALEPSMGEDRAEAHLRQLDFLRRALHDELWAKGKEQPSRKIAGGVAAATLAAVTGLTGAVGAVVGQNVYEAIRGVEDKAEEVVVRVEVENAREDEEPSLRERVDAAHRLLDEVRAVLAGRTPAHGEPGEPIGTFQYAQTLRGVVPYAVFDELERLFTLDPRDPLPTTDREKLKRLESTLNDFIIGSRIEGGVTADESESSESHQRQP